MKKIKMDPVISSCDKKCKQRFILDEVKEVVLEKDIKRTFFACPYCKTEYTVNYTNLEARDIQRKVQNLYEERKKPDADQGALMAAQKKLQIRFKEILEKLKSKYE